VDVILNKGAGAQGQKGACLKPVSEIYKTSFLTKGHVNEELTEYK
jgi:hypothetical protein